MKKRLASIIILTGSAAFLAVAEPRTFNGDGSSQTSEFTVDGPWLIDWENTSDFPMLASIEIRLYSADGNDFVGNVTSLKGTGRGIKMIEDGGEYYLDIVATSTDWRIQIRPLTEQQAETLIQKRGSEESLEERSREIGNTVPEESFDSWRAEDNKTLLLFENDVLAWRITFPYDCPDLKSQTNITFVSMEETPFVQFDSVLLEDGTRCDFAEVAPAYLK